MKGWLFFLAGVGCAIGAVLYFHGAPPVDHADTGTGSAPAETASSTSPLVSQTGACWLTKPVTIPSTYGTVTLPQGTALRYLGEQGGNITVANGSMTFSVTPDMVAGLTRQVEPAAPEPQATAPDDATAQGFLSTAGAFVMNLTNRIPWIHSAPLVSSFDFQKYGRFLLIADGTAGKASGSLVLYQGKVRLVTNAHVLSGIPDARFSQIDSQEVPTGAFSYADGADLAVADQSTCTEGLEMMTDVDKEVSVGDDVVVLGNSLGSDVVTVIPGKVTGLGPDLVEVDAKFVEGNSGSPIIHVKTGKLIGIATFATVRNVDLLSKDSQFNSGVRRFGYRLDTVQGWQHPSAGQFMAEAKTVEAVRKKTEYLFYLGRDLSNGNVSLSKYQASDSPLRDLVTEFGSDVGGLHPGGLDTHESALRFIRALSYETQSDINPLRRQDFTWYHWHELEMDMQARTVLKKAYDQMLSVAEARLDNPFR